MRRLQIDHLTRYAFSETVTLLPHQLLLRPREEGGIHIEAYELSIFPVAQLRWQPDAEGNWLEVASFAAASAELSIASRVLLRQQEIQPLDFVVAEHAVHYPFRYAAAEQTELWPYFQPIFAGDQPQVAAWLGALWQPGEWIETYGLLRRISQAIAREFSYVWREQPGVQAPAETLARRVGSCRDTATLFIEACRCLGLAARFVSGYLYSPFDQSGPGSTHAWAEVYLPGAGWKGFDCTSGLLAGGDHIAVAVSRHPKSIPPVAGAFRAATGQSPQMQVAVRVREIRA